MDSILDQQRGDQGLRKYVTAVGEYAEDNFSRRDKEFALKLIVRRIIQRGHGTSTSRRRCTQWWRVLREALKLANTESLPPSHPFFYCFPRYILSGILTACQLAAVQMSCPDYLAIFLGSHLNLVFQKAILFVSLGLGFTSLDHLLTLNITPWRSQRRCKELYNALQSLPAEDILALKSSSQCSNWQLKMEQLRYRWGLVLPWWQYYPTRWLPPVLDQDSTAATYDTISALQQEDSEHPPTYEAAIAISVTSPPPAYSRQLSMPQGDLMGWNDQAEANMTGLGRLSQNLSLQPNPKERLLLLEHQEIIGAILVLESPLSVTSLSKLLGFSEETIVRRIRSLRPVLAIPSDLTEPVQLCDRSFRDYLLDPATRHEPPLWVDKKQAHRNLAARCLNIGDSLKSNMCGLSDNTERARIDRWKIDHDFSQEMQYACRYWARHLIQGNESISEMANALFFLKKHFLHWMEAMSILGLAFEVAKIITLLQSVLHVDRGNDISRFLHDAKRFVLKYGQIADDFPLQIYTSCIFFAPEMSIVRKQFQGELPNWIRRLSNTPRDWSAELQALEGHSDIVTSLAFSPDGQLLASGSRDHLQPSDRAFLVWDTSTGALQPQRFESHSNRLCSVAFSPGGQLLASVCDKTVQLWDVATRALQRTLKGHQNSVNALSFSPDGRLLASGSGERFEKIDNSVRLWDTATGALRQTLRNYEGPVNSLAFSPDGLLLAVASTCTIQLLDAATGNLRRTLEGGRTFVESVAFSPNGRLLASGSNGLRGLPDEPLKLWDVATGTLHRVIDCDSGTVYSVAFSPDGRLLASAHTDQTVRLWAVTTGTLKKTFKGHIGSVASVAFSPDGGLLASASYDKTVRLWDVAVSDVQPTLEGRPKPVQSVIFSPNGQLLLSKTNCGTVCLWDAATGALKYTLKSRSNVIRTVIFSPDGQLLSTGSAGSSGTVQIWDTATGALRREFDGLGSDGSSRDVYSVAFSPSSRFLASGCIGNILIWDTMKGNLQQTLTGHTWSVESVVFSPDGQLLASGSYDKTIRLWNPFTGVLQHTFRENFTALDSLTFSPDGRVLVFASSNSGVMLWNTLTGTFLHSLDGHAVAFSPNGEIIASAFNGDMLGLWDVATGILQKSLQVNGRVTDLEFSADGSYLCTNLGYVEIGLSPESLPLSRRPMTNIFLAEDRWLNSHSGKALWLPPESRPSCSAVKDNILALGHASGQVSIFKIGD
ncbi:uncharacterized protein N7496_005509 [Penicillium cataractarum]|uniref:Anaphase-promoting complex subunit 4 WD40 domain-containing protein n=1 Tax=Penicillium cataractarum TaxID=2100454 RepID=A0A9W9VFZ4_9EURO|nr:uncharacterized protein N7496_005509 [Penicillium cataractarum]KAJ5378100.1 hypothetical protein N7496_005509 [Penicillium cataractarum]